MTIKVLSHSPLPREVCFFVGPLLPHDRPLLPSVLPLTLPPPNLNTPPPLQLRDLTAYFTRSYPPSTKVGLARPNGGTGHLVGAAGAPEVVAEGRVRGRVDTRNLDERAWAARARAAHDLDLGAFNVCSEAIQLSCPSTVLIN